MSHEHHRALDDFEAQLAALRPAASGLDRAEVLYAAGRAVGQTESQPARAPSAAWLWPLSTAASLLVALTFAALWWQRSAAPVEAPVVAEQPITTEQSPAIVDAPALALDEAPTDNYLRLRQVALSQGVDALPVFRAAGETREASPTRAFGFSHHGEG